MDPGADRVVDGFKCPLWVMSGYRETYLEASAYDSLQTLPRQLDGHAQASLGAIRRPNLSAVGMDYRLCNGEAETDAAGFRVAGSLDAIERRKDPLQLIGGDTRPIILYPDHQTAIDIFQPDEDVISVFHTVLNQVSKCPLQCCRLAVVEKPIGHFQLDLLLGIGHVVANALQ